VNLITSENFFRFRAFHLQNRYGLLVFLIFLLTASSLSGAEVVLGQRDRVCILAGSIRTQSQTLALLKESFEKKLRSSCDRWTEPMEQAFSLDSRRRLREMFPEHLFLFWFEERAKDSAFILRSIYLKPFLQFDMLKEPFPKGFYSEPLERRAEFISRLADRALGSLPFVGYVDLRGFVFWGSSGSLELEREAFEAHGLLPLIFRWKDAPWMTGKARWLVEGVETRLKIEHLSSDRPRFPYWLKRK
jgi:hypothetical protein